MLIDYKGYMLTQRQHPRMCLIHCRLENEQLIISTPEMPELVIDFTASTDHVKATVWQDECNALDCGDDASIWFSRFLDTSTRLVFFPDNEIRQVDTQYASRGDITAFSDGFPYLLISQASLDDLNNRAAVHTGSNIEMSRFRPNLVISGTEAFAEDSWSRIRIGDITFKIVKPCSRCIIPSINPYTAEKTGEPLKTLASYRMRDNKIFFGQNVIAEGTGELELGMPVEILA